jgi:hypothetical protein
MQDLYFITRNGAGDWRFQGDTDLGCRNVALPKSPLSLMGRTMRLELFELGHIQHKDCGAGLLQPI